MRLIRPYGESRTAPPLAGETSDNALTRQLLFDDKDARSISPRAIAPFLCEDISAVLAQWISAIDKIATKPAHGKLPTAVQRALRSRIGDEVWGFVVDHGIVAGDRKQDFDDRVHPYPEKDRFVKDPKRAPDPCGRWYKTFLGNASPETVTVTGLGKKIHDHLYEQARRIEPGQPKRRRGLIEERGRSIANNVLKPGYGRDRSLWDDSDVDAYLAKGDLARSIYDAVRAIENAEEREKLDRRKRNGEKISRFDISKAARKARPVRMRDLAPLFYAHYAAVFREGNHVPRVGELKRAYAKNCGMPRDAIAEQNAQLPPPPLLALHMEMKETYKRLLRGFKGSTHKSLHRSVPSNNAELKALLENRARNGDVGSLIRRGKVAYYELLRQNGNPLDMLADWNLGQYEVSPYWTSAGQAEIKRNEALVRAWRGLIGYACQTLTDWIDPKGQVQSDVTGSSEAFLALNSDDDLIAKARLLFGTGSEPFCEADAAERKAGWTSLQQAVSRLRHSTYHFAGVPGLLHGLKTVGATLPPHILARIWDDDAAAFSKRIADTLKGAKAHHFITATDLDHVHWRLVQGRAAMLPLPRFRRVLARASHAGWNAAEAGSIPLPSPHGRAAMQENPALLAQYVTLKLLYERVFGHWIDDPDNVPTARLKQWIDTAVDRSDKAAKELNDDEKAIARAARAQTLGDGKKIGDFLDRISRETASEIRVQKGYDPDPEAARRKSAYLDNLACDVMVQAFFAMMVEMELSFLCDLNAETPEINQPEWAPSRPATIEEPATWQRVLYLIAHLIPPGDMALFRNQIAKWLTLRDKAHKIGIEAQEGADADFAKGKDQIERVFDLYLSMHSAKFDGSTAMSDTLLAEIFGSTDAASRIFKPAPGGQEDERLPLRGLREMARFGHMETLKQVFTANPVAPEDITNLLQLEDDSTGPSVIVAAQKERERLHKKWIETGKPLNREDQEAYWTALASVVRHRHLSAKCRLTNQVRLNRVMVQVVGANS